MQPIFQFRHAIPGLDKLLDTLKIRVFSRFKALTVMKNKSWIFIGQNLGIYVCLAGFGVRDELWEWASIARIDPA
jgi:hypothetical protein